MDDRWVTVATFPNTTQAHVARSKLESEGIECHVEDENFNALYNSAMGSVKLKVRRSDFQDAIKALNVSPP